MWPGLIIIISPSFKAVPGVSQGQKNILIQALVAHFAVEAFDMSVVHRFAGADKIQPYMVRMRPGIQLFAGKFRPIVQSKALRQTPLQAQPLQRSHHSPTGKRYIHFHSRAAAIPQIHNR